MLFFDEKYFIKDQTRVEHTYENFIIEFLSTYNNKGNGKIHIVKGFAGIGKTLFFEKGIKALLSKEDLGLKQRNYIDLTIDFRNIDQDKTIVFYEDFIL